MKLLLHKFFAVLLILAMASLAAIPAPAQSRTVVRPHPFEPNEELVLVAEFSRAMLKNVDVAEFRFTSRREPQQQVASSRTPYSLRLTGEVSSKGFFAKLFNLRFREWMESIVEPISFTVHKTKRIDEQGKRMRVSEAVYGDGKVSWTESDPNNPSRTPRTADATFTGQVQDVLSAIYFLRTQPLILGKTFNVTISDSGRVYQVPVRVVEKKRMKTVLGRVEALRVDPELFGPNGMMARNGHISIWYTNDSRRIPVKAKIKTEYGTFDITLRKVIQKPASQEYVTNTLAGPHFKAKTIHENTLTNTK
ncbi:MAG: DUF3108 domain-containing protein [Acidobacteriota bacterium]